LLVTLVLFVSPLHAKFNLSASMLGSHRINSSDYTVIASFNSVPHPSQIAVIDDSGRVFWNQRASQVHLRPFPLHSTTFSLPSPWPHLKHGSNSLTLTLKRPNLPPSSILTRAFSLPLAAPRSRHLVIVDIDGTITRSDVRGHVLPLFGLSWVQPGVESLMSAIVSNGYQIIYLTSRPLFLADRTRRYLARLRLPNAPVITSPDGAFESLLREITGRAHEFKSEALVAISRTFCQSDGGIGEPVIHAAFGNRATDAKAYAAAGVDPRRTFIIDPRGRVVCGDGATHASCGSYAAILQRAHELFPPISI
jgi:phosphatidate phosphatase LPIN